MAASTTNGTSSKDLSHLPDISFAFVEEFIRKHSQSSGKEQMTKGFKYYSEEYVHSVSVHPDDTGCLVKGKCFRSQRKNESPHDVKIMINGGQIEYSFCTCTIGQSGYCGHVSALLYQLAHYKSLKMKLIPTDIAKTSLPQTWHVPRGQKLHGEKAANIVVQGYDREDPQRATKGIKSTLYNPIPGNEAINVNDLLGQVKDMDILFDTVVTEHRTELVQTEFGKFPKGSILSYQQKMASDYLLNLMDNNSFPELPLKNVMINNFETVLMKDQLKKYDSLKVTLLESKEIEEGTRLQSNDPKWHKIRRDRITASHAGEIAKRRADGAKLAERLQSTRHVQTAAMKRGIECEVTAAQAYSKVMNDNVNLYPCGVIVNPWCHWLAATPDRKVYAPDRNQPHGLLEIKCPNTDQLSSVKCLHLIDGELKLKKNDNYHYQIQMQMAVTGLDWCDFFVWLENDSHLETVYFDSEFWEATKDKLDLFFYTYFLN
ncbi:uncharacterized protein LOC143083892 [Mytilus galloprovincialis]|uniref:uncharacterized protein LOC143083892 n=1 Tax=Mytilus galloprovincialis TaxID=29158 RepID=UPI003F7B9B13